MGYFVDSKFNDTNVISTLKDYGFSENNYEKVIVAWDWDPTSPSPPGMESNS